jgi:galactofuranosylgalactofuranosylrhamnosyl-N-acetylglucosaminyl-diphospho-decaprenol beta-1,5/1,6-galactofuranosyltransferase
MLARSARQLRDIGKAWPDLRRRYRAALPELSSREAWAREVFDRR